MAEYNLGTAHGTVTIDSDTSGVDQANRSLGTLDDKTKKSRKALDDTAKVSGIAGAAIVGGLGVAVKTASDFEARMSAISAVSGATSGELDTLRTKALQLGAETSFSAGDAASAIEELIKSGLSVPDVMNGAADATVALAAAGEIELPEAASIASQALNQFKLDAEDLPGVADLLAGAANASATGVSEVGAALSYVGPVAQAAGLSIEDTAGAVALLANNGIDGQRAGTALRAILTQLQPSTKKATNAMKDLGLITEDGQNQFYNANGTLKDFDDIVGLLNGSMKGLSEEEKTAYARNMFGLESLSAISAIAGTTKDEFHGLQGSIKEVSATEVANKRLDNLAGSVEQLKGSAETLGIQLGSALLPTIRSITDAVTGVVNWFSSLDQGTQETIVQVALLAAGFLLGLAAFIKVANGIRSTMETLRALRILSTATQTGFVKMALKAVWSFLKIAAQAAASAARTVASWAGAMLRMTASAAAWSLRMIGAAARAAAGWAVNILKMVGRLAFLALQSAVQGARVAAVWTAQIVASAARGAVAFGIQVLRVVAGWALMGVQSLIRAAQMAAAWIIAMGPVGWIIAAVIALVALIIANWDNIKKWTIAAWNAVWNWIKKAAAWIVNLFLNWTLIGIIIKHWDSIKNAFSRGVTAVINFVRELPGKIKGFFAGIGKWLINAGKNLLEGLWNGISNAAGWLKDKVLGWAGDLIDGVKNFLGIGSPSRVFADYGGWLMEGMANGIDDSASQAIGAAQDAARGVLDVMQGSLDAGTMKAVVGASFTDGTVAALAGAGPVLAATAATAGPAARPTLAPWDPAAGGAAGGAQKVTEVNLITNNPIAERASDSEARRIRSVSALGAFGGDD